MYRKYSDITKVTELTKNDIPYCFAVYYEYDGYKEVVEYANFENDAIREITEYSASKLPKHVQKFILEHDAEMTGWVEQEDGIFISYKYEKEC